MQQYVGIQNKAFTVIVVHRHAPSGLALIMVIAQLKHSAMTALLQPNAMPFFGFRQAILSNG
ncbi:hypothetical protein GCM10022421_12830 [Oceanisphaera sediminis]|uniref:Uncharacterized protein n=1 Tax=Oceanisphaera sediminis TaxID=981381 RepID=A0ABP7DLE4_9GAMM